MVPLKRSSVVDDFYGTQVADPFRWLEDPTDPDTIQFMKSSRERTEAFLRNLPHREKIRDKLVRRYDYPKISVPKVANGLFFFLKNEGLWNQPAIFVQEGFDGAERMLFNPNLLTADGTIAVMNFAPSPDGQHVAIALSESGSDRQVVHVVDVLSGNLQTDKLLWCKFTNLSWTKDSEGFFYSRFPQPGTVPAEDENNYNQILYHRLGDSQQNDILCCAYPEEKTLHFDAVMSDDKNYLFIHAATGTDTRNRLWYLDLKDGARESMPVIRLIDNPDAEYSFVGVADRKVYLKTDKDAPNGRIVSVALDSEVASLSKSPDGGLIEVVSESKNVLEFAKIVHEELLVLSLVDAHHQLIRHSLAGTVIGSVALPTIGSIDALFGQQEADSLYFRFTSFLYPPTVFRFRYDVEKLDKFHGGSSQPDTTEFITELMFAKSKDETLVPLFVTHRRDLKRDGQNPTLLYGYGGFRSNTTPWYSPSNMAFVEAGGVFVAAVIRGGLEYGEQWHEAGMLHNKQNVFDDFISAAQYLIAQKFTSAARLGIMGGSNGGLLVAACMLQRPELFGAVICMVPVTDMLRYHRFTVGHFWTVEYGNADASREEFETLYGYSPLHNVREGAKYPPILITTGDTDDRVVPAHAMKFAATLQTKSGTDNVVHLRVETRAGHGAGKPTTKIIEEQTDIQAFLFHAFGLPVDHPQS